MTDQFRAMCAELVKAIEDDDFFRPTDPNNDALRFCKAVLSARTALAQPVVQEEDRPGCEGTPVASNSPCAVCGRALLAQPEPPNLMERAMNGDATAAKQFLHEAGFTDKQGYFLPQYQPRDNPHD
jgi:hypothetical protein